MTKILGINTDKWLVILTIILVTIGIITIIPIIKEYSKHSDEGPLHRVKISDVVQHFMTKYHRVPTTPTSASVLFAFYSCLLRSSHATTN